MASHYSKMSKLDQSKFESSKMDSLEAISTTTLAIVITTATTIITTSRDAITTTTQAQVEVYGMKRRRSLE